MSEECPVGGEHCAHWWDGEECCFCQLDGPVPDEGDGGLDVVTVEIRDGLL